MSHRYSHIQNFKDIDTEIVMLRIRKDVIRHEALAGFHEWTESVSGKFSTFRNLLGLIGGIFGKSDSHSSTFDKLANIAAIVGSIIGTVSNLRNKG